MAKPTMAMAKASPITLEKNVASGTRGACSLAGRGRGRGQLFVDSPLNFYYYL